MVAHLSVADGAGAGAEGEAGELDLWLSRYAAFQVASGVAPEHAARAPDKLAVLTSEEDEAVLREAGFSDVRMFYMGFAFRGWSRACEHDNRKKRRLTCQAKSLFGSQPKAALQLYT